MTLTTEIQDAVRHLVRHCGSLRSKEKFLVICDERTREIAELLAEEGRKQQAQVTLLQDYQSGLHGTEPGEKVARAMLGQDLIAGLTTRSLAHTTARRQATDGGARYLSLPEYTWELLSDPALTIDFREREAVVRRVAQVLTNADRIIVTSPAGTHLTLSAKGRQANVCPGYVAEPGTLGSPPDVEANVAPLETESYGVIVVDGSITSPDIGKVETSVTLEIKAGQVKKINCTDAALGFQVERILDAPGVPEARVVAELGIGLNPLARLTGCMLTDEGTLGTVHFGLGSNSTIGGCNRVSQHVDFVVREACVEVNDQKLIQQREVYV